MSFDLPALVRADKVIVATATWIERGPDTVELSAPLEMDGVAIEGLSLRGRARKSLIDREVIFQLEFYASQIIGGPIARIEWRPLNGHSNKGLGPKPLRHIVQAGSHHHCFDLNWAHAQEAVMRGDLPIAVPLDRDPTSFRALLAIVGKEFRIRRIQSITAPPWEPFML